MSQVCGARLWPGVRVEGWTQGSWSQHRPPRAVPAAAPPPLLTHVACLLFSASGRRKGFLRTRWWPDLCSSPCG